MSKRTLRFAVLTVVGLLLVGAFSTAAAQDRVQVTWFVGLGQGTDASQIDAQQQVTDDFNASQDEVELVLNVSADYDTGRDTLSTLIAAGSAPDIIGPVGVGGSNDYIDLWADLQPLVDSTGYDLSRFDPALVDLYRTDDGRLLGIPFAVYPSLTFYSRDLFDEAGLNYPPQNFGDPYVMPDGTEVPWNYDTVRQIAMILTVDSNGNDATMEGFDPDNIVQFGFNFQWNGMRLMWTQMFPYAWYNAADNSVTVPPEWYTASEWIWNGVWTDHFYPNNAYQNSELLNAGNTFPSGNVAMAVVPSWYTCCLDDTVGSFEWDFATVPQGLDGEYHVATDADTFRLTNQSKNPEAAFKALSYLLGDGAGVLTPLYGAFPANPDFQQQWVDTQDARYPMGIDWQLVIDSLSYNNPGSEHHESYTPNSTKVTDRQNALQSLILSETGADIDIDAEMDKFVADVNAIVKE